MSNVQQIRWHLYPDLLQFHERAARVILSTAREAIARSGQFRLVVAGGRTPLAAYRLLAAAETPWWQWHIYFGDERCVPVDHPDRNSVQVAEAWLNHIVIPAGQVHVIPAELGPDEAARRYAPVVTSAFPFDLVMLGLGEDGHTASLFPGAAHNGAPVIAVSDAPKPPSQRVSLSAASLSQARQVVLMVSGSAKRDAVAAWRAGAALPIAAIRPAVGIDVLIDHSAWPGE